MNKVFKVIFNKTTGSWVAVSELTKSQGKSSSSSDSRPMTLTTKLSTLAVSIFTLLNINTAYATTTKGGWASDGATASGAEAVAVGPSASASGANAVALGYNTHVSSTATALGAGIDIPVGFDGAVVIGNGSSTNKAGKAIKVSSVEGATIGTVTLANFAGKVNTENKFVSIAYDGQDDARKLVNLAAGDVSVSSTEAINGSQLYALASELSRVEGLIQQNSGSSVSNADITNLQNAVNGKASQQDLTNLQTAVDGKASQQDLTNLQTAVDGKASQQDLTNLQTAVDGKASQQDLTNLQTAVDGKASQQDLTNLQTAVDGKASQQDLTNLQTAVDGKASQQDLTNLQTAVDGKANQDDLEALETTVEGIETDVTDLKTRSYTFSVENNASDANNDSGNADTWALTANDSLTFAATEDLKVTTDANGKIIYGVSDATKAALSASEKLKDSGVVGGDIQKTDPNDPNAKIAAGNAMAMGKNSKATADNATATGNGAEATATNATANGQGSRATEENATASGQDAQATAKNATASGQGSRATAENATASGQDAQATAKNATASGQGSRATAENATANGQGAQATAKDATAMGQNSQATGEQSTALGHNAQASAKNSIALGDGSVADRENTLSVGSEGKERIIANVKAGEKATDAVNKGQLDAGLELKADASRAYTFKVKSDVDTKNYKKDVDAENWTLGANDTLTFGATKDLEVTTNETGEIVYGISEANLAILAASEKLKDSGVVGGNIQKADPNDPNATMAAEGAMAMGENSEATGEKAIAIGQDAQATGDQATAMGNGAQATAENATASGQDAQATAKNATANGQGSQATAENATANGQDAQATAKNATASGQGSRATEENATANGQDAQAMAKNATASGQGSRAMAENATASGQDAQAMAKNATASGQGSRATEENATANGQDAQAMAKNATASGQGSRAMEEGSTALGQGAQALHNNAVALGAGSVTDRANSVSVGAVGAERVIANVAKAEKDTDATNLGQVKGLIADSEGKTKAYMDKMGKKLRAGIASAVATANIPQVTYPGANLIGVGVGNYNGQSAIAVGYSKMSDGSRLILKVSAGATTQGNYSFGAGIGYQW